MAYVAEQLGVEQGAAASFIVQLPPHETGDLLLAVLTQDSGNSNMLAAPAGWTALTSRDAANDVSGAGSTMGIMYKIATSNAEPNPTWGFTASRYVGYQTFSIRDADQVTPIDVEAAAAVDNVPAAANEDFPAVVTTQPGTLMVYCIGNAAGIESNIPFAVTPGYLGYHQTANNGSQSVFVADQGAAGANSGPTAFYGTVGEGQQHTIAINNATSGQRQPAVANPGYMIHPLFNLSLPRGMVRADPSLTIASIDGIPVTNAIPSASAGLHRIPNNGVSRQDTGDNTFAGSEYQLSAPVDFTDSLFAYTNKPEGDSGARWIGTIAGRGIIVVLSDGTNWAAYQTWCRDQAAQKAEFAAQVIDPSQLTTPIDTSGVLDLTAVTSIYLLGRKRRNLTSRQVPACVCRLPKQMQLYGGGVDIPITGTTLEQIFDLDGIDVIKLQGERQLLFRTGIGFGAADGPTYLAVESESWEFSRSYDEAAGQIALHVLAGEIGVGYRGVAGDKIEHINSTISSPTPFYWRIEPGSTVAADWDFRGLTLIGLAPITLQPVTTFQAMSFTECGDFTDNGATIRSCDFVVGELTVADDGLINWNGSTDIEKCDFTLAAGESAHAIKFNAPGSHTFNALDFTGFGADETPSAAVYNDSGGLVTISISGGGDTPTVRNGAGASTVIVAGAAIDFTNLIVGSEVRVYRGTPDNAGAAVELDGVESSGTTFSMSHAESPGTDGYYVILSLDYANILVPFQFVATDQTVQVQQVEDREYNNP